MLVRFYIWFSSLEVNIRWPISLSIVVTAIIFVLLAGLLTLVERKFLAVLQQRVGPVVAGHRGLLQFLADALKVLFKEVILIARVDKFLLALLPISFFLVNLYAVLILTWNNNLTLIRMEYDFMVLVLVMAISNIIVIYTGFVLKNKYTQLSSNRAASLTINLDITLGFYIGYLVAQTGSFSFDEILKTKDFMHFIALNIVALIPLVCIALMDSGKAPFDLVEAETELVMGFFIDYSGFLFIIFLLGEYLHIFLMSYILQILLFG